MNISNDVRPEQTRPEQTLLFINAQEQLKYSQLYLGEYKEVNWLNA